MTPAQALLEAFPTIVAFVVVIVALLALGDLALRRYERHLRRRAQHGRRRLS